MLAKIEAIIREERLDPIRIELEKLGYYGMTVSEVKGRGKQGGVKLQWRAGEYCVEWLPKLKIEVVVLEKDIQPVLKLITRYGRTGEMGDGKIFVMPVDNCIRVRTGEEGVNAI